MKKALLLVILCGLVLPGFAEPASENGVSDSQVAFDANTLLDQLRVERVRAEARYASEDEACYALFAVTDCLKKLRIRRRSSLDELRRREVQIRDFERARKGAAQLNLIREKSAP